MGANAIVLLNHDAVTALEALADGTTVTLTTQGAIEQTQQTWNAVGILRGSDPVLSQQVVLLSAHLDHLGIGKPVDGDEIYNGADDDASGCVAVLELARTLAHSGPLKRTVLFVFFGSEETGGQGNQYFLAHPP